MSWRGIFVVLAGFGAVLLVAGLLRRETLPAERRSTGGLRDHVAGFRGAAAATGFFVGAALSAGLAGASMFAYISGATFVLQRIYGLSAQGFSLVFGLNSVGIMAMSQLGARLARRSPAQGLLGAGLT